MGTSDFLVVAGVPIPFCLAKKVGITIATSDSAVIFILLYGLS